MAALTLYPTQKPLSGTLTLPGDKSISHRAIFFASLSSGETEIHNLLEGEDVLCTIDCFRELGASIEKEGNVWKVKGIGLKGLRPPRKILYCGNSGTTFRLILGVLAAQNFETRLTGDASLNRRPMKRVMEPLSKMGAEFEVEGEGTSHRIVTVRGKKLAGIHYESPVSSAQVKSAILLAGLWASGETSITEPSLSRDHTERFFESCGVSYQRDGLKVSLNSVSTLQMPKVYYVPGDFSSAAFFLVAASLVPQSKVLLQKVGVNQTRTGALEILQKMGGKILLQSDPQKGEPLGNLEVKSAALRSVEIYGEELMPRLIDEIPILTIAAAQATGTTVIRDAQELRVKESDRIKSLTLLLGKLGVLHEERPDGLIIQGLAGKPFPSTSIQTFFDHRIAMSGAVASLIANGPTVLDEVESVNTSFPQFWKFLQELSST